MRIPDSRYNTDKKYCKIQAYVPLWNVLVFYKITAIGLVCIATSKKTMSVGERREKDELVQYLIWKMSPLCVS